MIVAGNFSQGKAHLTDLPLNRKCPDWWSLLLNALKPTYRKWLDFFFIRKRKQFSLIKISRAIGCQQLRHFLLIAAFVCGWCATSAFLGTCRPSHLENSELTNQWGWQFSANFLLKEPTCAVFASLIRILLEPGFYLQGHRRKPSHSCAPWTCGPFGGMQKVDSIFPVSLPLDSRQQLEGGANSFPTAGFLSSG